MSVLISGDHQRFAGPPADGDQVMAEVLFPADAEVSSMQIEPWNPGQIALSSPFTSSVQVLNRSHPSWRGQLEIAITDRADRGRSIEAFLVSLGGQANWAALPLDRGRLDPVINPVATVASVINLADGTVEHGLVIDDDLQTGDWLTAQSTGARVFIVRKVTGASAVLDPQIPLAVGDQLSAATTIRARAQSARPPRMPRTPDWWGPWRFDWQEAL